MRKIVISPQANIDLTDIGDYIANELHNPHSARALIGRIKKSVFALEEFPEMGTPIEAKKSTATYRYTICGNYMIFYHIDDERVLIDRVLYGRRDYLGLLFGAELNDDFE